MNTENNQPDYILRTEKGKIKMYIIRRNSNVIFGILEFEKEGRIGLFHGVDSPEVIGIQADTYLVKDGMPIIAAEMGFDFNLNNHDIEVGEEIHGEMDAFGKKNTCTIQKSETLFHKS